MRLLRVLIVLAAAASIARTNEQPRMWTVRQTGAIDRIMEEARTPAAPTRAAKTPAKIPAKTTPAKRATGRASSKGDGAKKSAAPPRAPGKTAGSVRKAKGRPGARRKASPTKIGRQRRLTKRR